MSRRPFPAADVFRLSSIASGHGDPRSTYSDPGASVIPSTSAEAAEADLAQARLWYKNRMSVPGDQGAASVTFERLEPAQRSAGEAMVDTFCANHAHVLPSTGALVHKSRDEQRCTVSVSLLRLVVHSTNAPAMTSASGVTLFNCGRKYDAGFIARWQAAIGSLVLRAPSSTASTSSASGTSASNLPATTETKADTKAPGTASPARAATEALPTTPEPALRLCARCGKSAAQRCGRCRRANYCTRECQSLHWHAHKLTCGARVCPHDTAVA